MNYFQLGVNVLGGLAIFVYGMGLMSDGLTQIAGARLRAVLAYVTRNRLAAILAGTVVTAIIQSSSATSVMTVGFVNAGLLSLTQAIGVIFGANIGTTVTGQLVSLNLSDLAMPAVVIGVVGLLISRRTVTRGLWRTLLGFGFLFFGMNLMSHELDAVAKLPSFVSFFSSFDCAPSTSGFLPFGNVLGAVAVGTICTMIVQSSSATIGITIALAQSGLISIWTAVPIVLGDNIGTTVTAAFAAINTNANARRTALAHALFNVIGTTILVTTFIFVFGNAAGVRAPAFFHLVNACTEGNAFAGENPGRYVAMAHTLFNVTNVIVLSSFIPLLARLCEWIISEKRRQQNRTLEPHLLAAPEVALHAATVALADMTRRAWTVASCSLNSCLGKADVNEDSVQKAEADIDGMQTSIRNYLIEISRRKITDRQAQMIPELIHCVNDAERISDIALRIYRKTARVRRDGLPDDVRAELNAVVSRVRTLAHGTVHAVRAGTPSAADPAEEERKIQELARTTTHSFAARVQSAGGAPEGELAVLSVLAGLRDISRHLGNIATRVPHFAA